MSLFLVLLFSVFSGLWKGIYKDLQMITVIP